MEWIDPTNTRCKYGHFYPAEYNADCSFCVELKKKIDEQSKHYGKDSEE